jgi:hypothetical protein
MATSTGGQPGAAGAVNSAGGAGGMGFGGDMNLAGGDGTNGASVATIGTGGDGGDAPRGGLGGAGGDDTAGAVNGGNGEDYGGGGGGSGTQSDDAGGGDGGDGGAGGYVIYEYTTQLGGADIAENYPVASPNISAGDIVSFDPGMPITVKLAERGDNRPLAGVISTKPGITLGEEDAAAAGQRPVALSGRVPVKFSSENGDVQIGDRITLSATPGVGKKANVFDDTVGIVIAPVEHTESGETVMIFMDLQPGTDINAIAFSLLGNNTAGFGSSTGASTTMPTGPLDFVGGMMSAIGKRISMFSFGAQATSSATSTAATASSTPSMVDSFAQTLIQSITEKIMQILATAGNGLSSIFADAIHAKDEICIDDQCLSREDVETLLKITKNKPSPQAATASAPVVSSDEDEKVTIEIQGNNPATIQVGDVYIDLGARIIAPESALNLKIDTLVDGLLSETVTIDTSFPAEHVVKYRVIDSAGYVSEIDRTIRVIAPVTSGGDSEQNVASSTPEVASSTPSLPEEPSAVEPEEIEPEAAETQAPAPEPVLLETNADEPQTP